MNLSKTNLSSPEYDKFNRAGSLDVKYSRHDDGDYEDDIIHRPAHSSYFEICGLLNFYISELDIFL